MIGIKAHNINQLIGAPLIALIDAECQSAAATAKFISDIGFSNSDSNNSDSNSTYFGKLKMITFSYEKCYSNGTIQKFKMEIPLLSLVQIPILKIRDAKINCGIKIIATDKHQNINESDKSNPFLSSISKEKLDIIGLISQNSSNSSKVSTENHLEISMNLEQSDLPLGVLNLLNSMNDMIKIVPV